MSVRRTAALGAAAVCVALTFAACSSSSSSSTSTTTTAAKSSTTQSTSTPISGVDAPVVLTPQQTAATVKVGQVVTFDMGDPGQGSDVAVSDDTSVFQVDSEGTTKGGTVTNPGGTAVGVGVAKVSVSFRGATNGVGTPTTFTITVK